ncbi:SAV_6107 family HEPN domain-containing protein [Cellulomonas fimi]|uniref:Colicin transporter n=1 Tax=Cellulomonas fimi TaxID=1708 RepID=A0A7Y0LYL7_CELFI|nr:SAV_6107 family HEPN domain-containing protein [Cellulomonas fimi]NMR20622.1 colicin transporter [Cellulomonas fimi]
MNPTAHAAPLPPTAVDLLRRADAELLAAQFSSEAGERFVHAHLAALRAAAAVLAVHPAPKSRRTPRTVWELLAGAAPELESWSLYFAAGAGLRQAVEAGRTDAVDAARAEELLCASEDFLHEARGLLVRGRRDASEPVDHRPGAAHGSVGRRQLLAVRAS